MRVADVMCPLEAYLPVEEDDSAEETWVYAAAQSATEQLHHRGGCAVPAEWVVRVDARSGEFFHKVISRFTPGVL